MISKCPAFCPHEKPHFDITRLFFLFYYYYLDKIYKRKPGENKNNMIEKIIIYGEYFPQRFVQNKNNNNNKIMYDLFEEWRDENWYEAAGASMQKKANYLRLGIYNIDEKLGEPTEKIPYPVRQEMQRDKRSLSAALKRIEEAYSDRCKALKDAPKELRAFKKGFTGS